MMTNIQALQPYRASAALERFIDDAAPLHYVAKDAPDSYEELAEFYETLMQGEPIPVSGDGCANSIYSNPGVNHSWRAYHGGIHIVHELDFSVEDETQAMEIQLAHMLDNDEHYCFQPEDYEAVKADVLGQRMYYVRYGKYVNDQARFVASCLACGILATLDAGDMW